MQQQVFADLLTHNAAYLEEKRILTQKRAEVREGEEPPPSLQPALAGENPEPSGKFGLYFNGGMAGMAFLSELHKGLATRGTASEAIYDPALHSPASRRLSAAAGTRQRPLRTLSADD